MTVLQEFPEDGSNYKVVVADPPWQYSNVNTGGSMSSGSAAKYSTMTFSQIKALSVREISDKDGSVLFLWCTVPMLPLFNDLMTEWGFTYKTAISWVKTGGLGMGFWFRGQFELCLVGVRGKNMKPFRAPVPNVIYSKAREHSRKPDEFWQLIEPILEAHEINPRIELFARGSGRPGWDTWGLEAI